MNKNLAVFGSLVIVAIVVFSFTGNIFSMKRISAGLAAVIDSQDNIDTTDTAATNENTASSSPLTLTQALQDLQNQQRVLENEVASLRQQLKITDTKADSIKTMKLGDSGDEVQKLQELMQQLPEIYPADVDFSSLVSGYYGPLTESAIKNFQENAGLNPTGIADEETKSKLYEQVLGRTKENDNSLALVNLTSISEIKNLANLQNQFSQLSSTVSSTQAVQADLQNQVTQLASDLAGLQTTVAGISNTPASSSSSTASTPIASTPSPTALVISNIQVSGITKNSATITWTTNNSSTSEIDYSQNSSLPTTNQTVVVANTTMVTTHRLNTQSLNPGTKYYYRVVSKDANGTTLQSAILTFNTAS